MTYWHVHWTIGSTLSQTRLKDLLSVIYIKLVVVQCIFAHALHYINYSVLYYRFLIFATLLTLYLSYFRYVVGKDANIIFRFMWNLPDWLCDFILSKM